ncbi:MAG: hypothetical protein F6K30_21745 [Cyanothece sp. SIO2G6]|nr:hypothetical protein [Cyanothece sp. SIO2G6]
MDYRLLNLGPASSVVTDISIDKWCSEVTVSCLYDPSISKRPYELLFKECRGVSWELIEEENLDEVCAELIGLNLGLEKYEEAASITTDIFEMLITYGTAYLAIEDRVVHLNKEIP